MLVFPATREAQIGGQPRHKVRLYLKNNQHKKGWRHGSSGRAREALSSNPSTVKKRKTYSTTKNFLLNKINAIT
jgi:ribosomal protein L4